MSDKPCTQLAEAIRKLETKKTALVETRKNLAKKLDKLVKELVELQRTTTAGAKTTTGASVTGRHFCVCVCVCVGGGGVSACVCL